MWQASDFRITSSNRSIGRLELQHRLEEVGERFNLEVSGLDLVLPYTQLISERGISFPEMLADIASHHGLQAMNRVFVYL